MAQTRGGGAGVVPRTSASSTSHGSAVPVLYDASRLCTRVLNPTPNGIDRLDGLLARGLLARGFLARGSPEADEPPALIFGWRGPRLLPAATILTALDRTERSWREVQAEATDDAAVAAVAASLVASDGRPIRFRRRRSSAVPRAGRALRTLAALGLRRGRNPVEAAAHGAVYLNASHFPLDWPSHVAWLDRRRDIAPVMLVHDLIPVDRPDWFRAGEGARHRDRLAWLARRGAAAIVTSQAVEERLRDEMARAGRHDLPVLRSAPPVSASFRVSRRDDPRLARARYFVVCGTIEPRKNHALLLRLWLRFAAERGAGAPELLVVGKRGWRCDDVIEGMRRLAGAGHLVVATGLPSGAYRRLLDASLALLAPSWAEGFGLPLAEALARGVPAIASDIAPFREQGADLLIDPRDEDAWYAAISALAETGRRAAHRPRRPAAGEQDYLATVRGFLEGLA